ncbi:type IV secretion system DNA-binding domain-containing protein, partial [Salmonella enterica]|uniref:type IV secretion system DNA-binding domain-containing protein n=1 Tax=Salmonella enterica TaxID=28901 RepID=UPI003D2CC0CC
ALLTLWMNMAVNALMRLERTRDLRTWFLFDEVHALHRLPAIEHGLQTARAFGGAFVLGMHSFDKLAETYGEQGAINLAALARTKLIL